MGCAGLIISEATAIDPIRRITPYDVGIWSDAHIEPLERVPRVIKENGSLAGVQIAHAGRKAGSRRPWDIGRRPYAFQARIGWMEVGALRILSNCAASQSGSVELIDCSSGVGVAQAKVPAGLGYQVPILEAVWHGADILTATVGLITSPETADEIIRNGRADLVLLGREMLRNPY